MSDRRHIRSFSFPARDLNLLRASQARARTVLPGATESEAVRLGLELMSDASQAELEKAAARLVRKKPGRPRTQRGISQGVRRSLEEDEARLKRLRLLDELTRMEEDPGSEDPERLTELYAELGMVPRAKVEREEVEAQAKKAGS